MTLPLSLGHASPFLVFPRPSPYSLSLSLCLNLPVPGSSLQLLARRDSSASSFEPLIWRWFCAFQDDSNKIRRN
ncbi:hypothetical protein E2C01_092108 [Portunus trituberculatus]|uniref:Uncharacterized protein n=1 Tax=Portunus trituberculatus TaxID=210409 RepID=A0A5B7JPQ9_PORTR|nr:hypothetical protein [Portunus trituberculatus]